MTHISTISPEERFLRLSSPCGQRGETSVEQIERVKEGTHRACRLLLLHLTVGSALDLSDCTHERRKLFYASYRYVRPGRLEEFTSTASALSLEERGNAGLSLRGFLTQLVRESLVVAAAAAAAGGDCGLLGASFRESVKQVSRREQQMFFVDMRSAEE